MLIASLVIDGDLFCSGFRLPKVKSDNARLIAQLVIRKIETGENKLPPIGMVSFEVFAIGGDGKGTNPKGSSVDVGARKFKDIAPIIALKCKALPAATQVVERL